MLKGSKRDSYKKRKGITTYTGHPLTLREEKFITLYLEGEPLISAVEKAGYKNKAPKTYANELLNKPYIDEEINYRINLMREKTIANATEILSYFSDVMRGNIKDQFQLDAPLAERTRAAQELAKRIIDPEIKTKQAKQIFADNSLNVNIVWDDNDKKDNTGEDSINADT